MNSIKQVINSSAGLVGLPNVGKSALFNALAASPLANSKNFPFCTINPQTTRISVPDKELDIIAKLAKSQKTIYNSLELHDIAGLIKGANKGEGLGNQFLANIRNVGLIIHVLRCFENKDILHVSMKSCDKIDPVDDMKVVEIELLLADLASIERRLEKNIQDQQVKDFLIKLKENLELGRTARDFFLSLDQVSLESKHVDELYRDLFKQLLTAKPVLYVCNVDEAALQNGYNKMTLQINEELKLRGDESEAVIISAGLEEEACILFDNELDRMNYLKEYGLVETGLMKVSSKCAQLLGQTYFYTVGTNEARSWPIPINFTAFEAAGKIHSDIKKGFISADVISCSDYIQYMGEKGAKAAGKNRSEGRDYVIQKGDCIYFNFNQSI